MLVFSAIEVTVSLTAFNLQLLSHYSFSVQQSLWATMQEFHIWATFTQPTHHSASCCHNSHFQKPALKQYMQKASPKGLQRTNKNQDNLFQGAGLWWKSHYCLNPLISHLQVCNILKYVSEKHVSTALICKSTYLPLCKLVQDKSYFLFCPEAQRSRKGRDCNFECNCFCIQARALSLIVQNKGEGYLLPSIPEISS